MARKTLQIELFDWELAIYKHCAAKKKMPLQSWMRLHLIQQTLRDAPKEELLKIGSASEEPDAAPLPVTEPADWQRTWQS